MSRLLSIMACAAILLFVSLTGCAGPMPPRSAATSAPYPLPLPSSAPAATSTPSGPPPPPTGSPPARIPADATIVGVRSTSTPDPKAAATVTPTPIVIPTQPPWNIVTPSATWTTYRDPNFGFSFQYPANWHLDAPLGPRLPPLPEGLSLVIRNFDTGLRKGPAPADAIAIQIDLLAELVPVGTVDKWLAQEKQKVAAYPEVSYSAEERLTVNNLTALRYTITSPSAPQGRLQVAMGNGRWIYLITTDSPKSPNIATFNQVVASFQAP